MEVKMTKKNIKKDLIMTPMPVLIIGTYDENNVPNAMNAAWGIQSDFEQITIYLSKHKTTENLKLKKAFTVAFATKETLAQSDYFGIESGKNLNKIEKVGFHTVKSEFVDAPIIQEYPLTIECEVAEMVDESDGYRLVGNVVNVIADDSVLDEKGRVNLGKMNIISYDSATHSYRLVGDIVGQAFHDGLSIKNKS
ncbi:MAG: flavin reductase family protein [Alphaproteobacteria bacterium]|nr:flavin reductase family protein [Alphaproteobacteria bacterium]